MGLEARLRDSYMRRYPAEVARLLETLPVDEQSAVLAAADPVAAAGVLVNLISREAIAVLQHMPPVAAAGIVAALDTGAAVLLLRHLARLQLEPLLAALPASLQRTVDHMLASAPGTVAELVDSQVLALPSDIRVSQALRRVRAAPRVLSVIPLVERDQRLLGVTLLADLLRARLNAPLRTLADRDSPRLNVNQPQSDCVLDPGWRTLSDLPVVDPEGRYVGCVTHAVFARLRDKLRLAGQRDTIDTLLSLGEAYWRGLGQLVDDVTTAHRARERGDDGADSRER